MQFSIICLVLFGFSAWEARCNPAHYSNNENWNDGNCNGNHLEYVTYRDGPLNQNNLGYEQLSCNNCGSSDCNGICENSLEHSQACWDHCSGDDNCECSSCQTINEQSYGNGNLMLQRFQGYSSPSESFRGQVTVHHGKPIIIQPAETKFYVPAAPVIFKPHLIHNPTTVNVQPRIITKARPTPVQVKPVVVKVIRQNENICCPESPCNLPECPSCQSLNTCSLERPCNNPGCPICGGGQMAARTLATTTTTTIGCTGDIPCNNRACPNCGNSWRY